MKYNQRKTEQLILVLLLAGFIISACGLSPANVKDVPKPVPEKLAKPFNVLQGTADQYLKKNNRLYIEPEEVLTRIREGESEEYLLVDIRTDEHYAHAHIPGAIHIAYGDTWRPEKLTYLPKDKKIVIIDYSGHTASQTAATWNMLGFDAVPMRYGMAGWSQLRDVIGGSPKACQAYGFPVVTTAVSGTNYTLPSLDVTASSVQELIMARAEAAVKVPPVILPPDLKDKLQSYFVIDIRSPEHYGKGHIETAVNIPFSTLTDNESLRQIPSDKTLAIVCYDGHTASQAARILNMLGYNATALKDGMSAWTADAAISGTQPIACNVSEKPVTKLNALLKPAPSTGAT